MKRLLTLIVGLGLVAWGTGVANANELSNGNLNPSSVSSQMFPTPSGWTVVASRAISGPFNDGASSEGFANADVADPDGTNGLFFKPFTENPTDGNVSVHFYQDKPGAPGTKYTLTGWAGAEANYVGLDPGNTTTKSELAVEFLNAGSSVIGGSTNDLKAAGLGTSGEEFGYAQYMVMATAPAGTVSVRARASMIDAFNNAGLPQQAFVVDVFELTSEAPVGAPVITNQPVHQTVSPGANVTFSVGVSNPPVSYQWKFNETNNIAGATSQTLTLMNVSGADAGHYSVRVSNSSGTVEPFGTLTVITLNFYPTVTFFGGTGDTNANELANGNLNVRSPGGQAGDTPTNWVVDASRFASGPYNDGASSEDFANAAIPDGPNNPNKFGLFFKSFQGTDPGDRLTVHFYQDNPGTPGRTYTLTGWAGAEANYSGLIITDPPTPTKSELAIDFDDDTDNMNGVISSAVLDLQANGLGTGPGERGYAQYMVMATAPAGTVSVRARASMIEAFNNAGLPQQAFVVDFFELTSEAPPGSPVITNQPVSQTVSPGANVTFSVGVSNPPVSYQWKFNKTNIDGATSQTLTLMNVSEADAGHYNVFVSNPVGTAQSAFATLTVVTTNFYPTVTIFGKVGDNYRVDYADEVTSMWTLLSLITPLPTSPFLVADTNSPTMNMRFYRALYLPQ